MAGFFSAWLLIRREASGSRTEFRFPDGLRDQHCGWQQRWMRCELIGRQVDHPYFAENWPTPIIAAVRAACAFRVRRGLHHAKAM